MSKFKLIISDRIEFDVKFTLNDGGVEKPFGVRLAANRLPLDEMQKQLASGITVGDFLAAREVTMKAWIGEAPLVDEKNQPVPPGPEALKALQELVAGTVALIHVGYLEANGAKGRAGN